MLNFKYAMLYIPYTLTWLTCYYIGKWFTNLLNTLMIIDALYVMSGADNTGGDNNTNKFFALINKSLTGTQIRVLTWLHANGLINSIHKEIFVKTV